MKRIAFILILFLANCSMDSQKDGLPFNSEIWKGADKRVRGRMALDLQNSRLLINKSKPEVEEMLGKPNDDQVSLWLYDVDMGGLSKIQFDQLNVFFDKESDKVSLSYVAN